MPFYDIGITNIYAFILGAFLIVICPGPNCLYVLSTSIRHGAVAAIRAMLAVLVGDGFLILASYLGIASLLKANPELFYVVKALGASYLCYLGCKLIYSTIKKKSTKALHKKDEVKSEDKDVKSFRTALLLSLTNPKAILFFMAFFVQFIDNSAGHGGLCYLILATIMQFFSFSFLVFLIVSGRGLVNFVKKRPSLGKFGNRLTGSVFLLFAAKLITDF